MSVTVGILLFVLFGLIATGNFIGLFVCLGKEADEVSKELWGESKQELEPGKEG